MARIERELEGARRAAAVARAFRQRAGARLAGRAARGRSRAGSTGIWSSRRAGRAASATIRSSFPTGIARSFGEMTAQEKHGLPRDNSLALSHRARAFQKLARALID